MNIAELHVAHSPEILRDFQYLNIFASEPDPLMTALVEQRVSLPDVKIVIEIDGTRPIVFGLDLNMMPGGLFPPVELYTLVNGRKVPFGLTVRLSGRIGRSYPKQQNKEQGIHGFAAIVNSK